MSSTKACLSFSDHLSLVSSLTNKLVLCCIILSNPSLLNCTGTGTTSQAFHHKLSQWTCSISLLYSLDSLTTSSSFLTRVCLATDTPHTHSLLYATKTEIIIFFYSYQVTFLHFHFIDNEFYSQEKEKLRYMPSNKHFKQYVSKDLHFKYDA